MTPRRAIIIGGSISGLFTAILLRRRGWDAHVYERVPGSMDSRGAGIVTHPELEDALVEAGLDPANRLGVHATGRVVLDRLGNVVEAMPLPQTLTSWDRIWVLLRHAIPDDIYHHGMTFERYEETPHGIVAHFADGSRAEGDLLVAADGILSAVRRQAMPAVVPRYVGYTAWRGLVDEAKLSPATHAQIFEKFAFCLPDREQMLGYPVAGLNEELRPGHRRYNFVWYRPADLEHDVPVLFTDAEGKNYGTSIPPQRIHPKVIAKMRADAEALLAPAFAEIVRLTDLPLLQAIFDLAAPRLFEGRVALVGDAGFVARPHVGMGVTKAAGDTVALARALAAHDDIDIALAAYDAVRRPYGDTIIRRARHLGAYLQAQISSPEDRVLAERHRQPAAVMAETAVSTGMSAW